MLFQFLVVGALLLSLQASAKDGLYVLPLLSSFNPDHVLPFLRSKLSILSEAQLWTATASSEPWELKSFLDSRLNSFPDPSSSLDCDDEKVYPEIVMSLLNNEAIAADNYACLPLQSEEEILQVARKLDTALTAKMAELLHLTETYIPDAHDSFLEELRATGLFENEEHSESSRSSSPLFDHAEDHPDFVSVLIRDADIVSEDGNGDFLRYF